MEKKNERVNVTLVNNQANGGDAPTGGAPLPPPTADGDAPNGDTPEGAAPTDGAALPEVGTTLTDSATILSFEKADYGVCLRLDKAIRLLKGDEMADSCYIYLNEKTTMTKVLAAMPMLMQLKPMYAMYTKVMGEIENEMDFIKPFVVGINVQMKRVFVDEERVDKATGNVVRVRGFRVEQLLFTPSKDFMQLIKQQIETWKMMIEMKTSLNI